MHLGERLRCDAVIGPSSLAQVGDETGLLQHAQVKRQSGLRCLQLILEVTDAPLATAEHLENPETRLVGERVEELCGPRRLDDSGSHGSIISTVFDMSSAPIACQNLVISLASRIGFS